VSPVPDDGARAPEIVRMFHGSQICRDVLEVGRFYHDFFGSWVYEAQYLDAEDARNSANLMGGGFSIELLAPVDPDADTGVARFLRRHGSHFNNIAFWARDCRGLAQQLIDRGVRVAVRGGGFSTTLPEGSFDYVITHPKDTHGLVLEFLEDQLIHDPRDRPWWDDGYWRDHHPLGVLGLLHCTVAVTDLDASATVLTAALGCDRVHDASDAEAGERAAYFAMGDTLIEVATPAASDSPMAQHLAEHGSMLYRFTFLVRDLAGVERHAREHGVGFVRRGGSIELDPEHTCGGVFAFTEQAIGAAPSASGGAFG
jgi:glyoxalase/bleomycin resistance protein/dioxygenase superfamily protein